MNDTKEKTTPATATTNAPAPAAVPAPMPEMKLAVSENIITALDKATENGIFAMSVTNQFKKMFMLGACMAELKNLLTPEVMKPIMQLQNSPIGFLTDQPAGGYTVEIVRNAIIEAAINGVSVCGNEFNIIAKRFYMTKNGLKHKLHDIPGLYKNITPGIPKMVSEKGALVNMHIEWTYNGDKHEKDIQFAIRVNAGMGTDAIIGKGMRKAYAWLYEEVTGNSINEGDVTDDVPITTVAAEVSPIEAEPEKAKTAPAPAADPAAPAPAPANGDDLLDM